MNFSHQRPCKISGTAVERFVESFLDEYDWRKLIKYHKKNGTGYYGYIEDLTFALVTGNFTSTSGKSIDISKTSITAQMALTMLMFEILGMFRRNGKEAYLDLIKLNKINPPKESIYDAIMVDIFNEEFVPKKNTEEITGNNDIQIPELIGTF